MNPILNQRNGAAFERVVAKSFAADRHFAMEKVTPPARIVGRRVIFCANPFLDFTGIYLPDDRVYGIPVFVECKVTTEAKLRLGKGGLSDEQRRAMRRWSDHRGIAFLLWCRIGHGVCVLSSAVIDEIAKHARSLKHPFGPYIPVRDGLIDVRMALAYAATQNKGCVNANGAPQSVAFGVGVPNERQS